jgi:hypothetical protein
MAKKNQSRSKFIKQIDWPSIIFLLFLVAFLGCLTYRHYFTQQQQLRWQQIQDLQAAEMNQINQLDINADMLKQADLNQDEKIDQLDIEVMQAAFLNIDSKSLVADLNQDSRVDTQDYAILAYIIRSQANDDTRNEE